MPDRFSRLIIGRTLHEDRMPFDLHFARLLIAPRAVISTDALQDTWANPYGTTVTWRAAQEVFDFLGMPKHNAMHMRDGLHDFQPLDWRIIADFADTHFEGKEPNPNIVYAPDPPTDGRVDMDWRNERLHYSWRNPLA